MKALILAGGRGKRMEELSETENKCMLQLYGRPLIRYSLDNAMALADIKDIIVVVGYRAESIINMFGTDYHGKRICYVIQREQKGLVHAMECARDSIAGDDFFLFLADEVILGGRHQEMVNLFYKDNIFCMCGVYPQKNLDLIKRNYALIYGPEKRIYRLIEKPPRPFKPVMGTGNIIFRNRIFDYLDACPVNPFRGEKELPDLIQCAVDDGEVIKWHTVCDRYINVNSVQEWKMVEMQLAETDVQTEAATRRGHCEIS